MTSSIGDKEESCDDRKEKKYGDGDQKEDRSLYLEFSENYVFLCLYFLLAYPLTITHKMLDM